MSEIVPFGNDEFSLDITPDGDSFRVQASALARCLSVSDAHSLLRNIPADEKGSALVQTASGEQRTLYVTEAGFYRAIGQRQTGRIVDREVRAQVERFQKWVFGEVLPRLRRGELVQASNPTSEIDLIIASAQAIKRMQAQVEQASAAAIEAAQDARAANARIDAMEGRHNWYSALGYSILHGFATDNVSTARFGKVAASIARAEGIKPNKVQHAHFAQVNEFPERIWAEAAAKLGLGETA